MGFERRVKKFTLQFPEDHYQGLEVVMGSLTTDQFLEVTELSLTVQADKVAGDARKLFEITASRLQSWNLEDMGQPVPATLAGLMDQEFEFVIDVVAAWLKAIGSVTPPLPSSSDNGGRLLEASIPMAPLSASQPS